MLGEQLLLCLLLPGGEGGVKRRAQLIALSISRLIHDPSVRILLAQGAGRRRDVGELLKCVKLLGTGWIEKLDGMAGWGVRSEKSSGLWEHVRCLGLVGTSCGEKLNVWEVWRHVQCVCFVVRSEQTEGYLDKFIA